MAFHPPKCAYQLYVLEKDGTKKPAKSAKEIYGKREVGLILTYDKKAPQTLELEAAKGDVFSVRTARGNYLVGVRARPRVASKRQVPIVVLQAQPNATDVGQFLDPRVATIGDMANYFGCDVYMFDYSGYGRSTGSPSEKDAYSDIRAVYDYILNLHAATGVKIVLVGISIGTAVVVDLAAQHPAHLSGVVLVAPFTSGCRLLKNVPGREEPLCCDRFRNFEKADDLNVPVLVIHGMEDDQIPASHGIALAKRLRKKSDLVLVTGGTHSNILAFTSVYSRIRDFVLYGTSQ
ncbi:Protein F01D5.8 [Aphelenchoides avenae]|nr:Protein F01D5.8 [Aphelenchus avenae]